MCASIKMYNHYTLLSREQIEDSLIQYNPIHLNTIEFDHAFHVIQQINTIEEIQYVLGIIGSIIGIYYFVVEIFTSLKQN
jgi:hypothetical protein